MNGFRFKSDLDHSFRSSVAILSDLRKKKPERKGSGLFDRSCRASAAGREDVLLDLLERPLLDLAHALG